MKSATTISIFWHEDLREWFEQNLLQPKLKKTDRDRLVRLATDPRMKTVAVRLEKEWKLWLTARQAFDQWLAQSNDTAPPTDRDFIEKPVTTFLTNAWHAPVLWQSVKKMPRTKPGSSNRRKQLLEFQAACDRLCKLLEYHEDLAVEAIFHDEAFVGEGLWPREKFGITLHTVQTISSGLGKDIALHWMDEEAEVFPGKMDDPDAEEVFCIRYLVKNAMIAFGKPLYGEVAILVTIMLDIDDIPIDRVKKLWTSKTKWRSIVGAKKGVNFVR